MASIHVGTPPGRDGKRGWPGQAYGCPVRLSGPVQMRPPPFPLVGKGMGMGVERPGAQPIAETGRTRTEAEFRLDDPHPYPSPQGGGVSRARPVPRHLREKSRSIAFFDPEPAVSLTAVGQAGHCSRRRVRRLRVRAGVPTRKRRGNCYSESFSAAQVATK
ncbi:hypothetical protein BOSEA31B_10470 [Hyphomicrobiales bacterium]|nr:hypothetical protein BOSEA31B_10470 [Hyphomicrobiales bacterium]CAH1700324.1 hypothetical protein BOSEA1005_20023 [Hyphomicrobiales bacterium]CAI0344205.1 hypothetical protein BO1005MUT1_320035 [Hyphomicrobiales bacterium]